MRFFEENWLWRGTQSAIFYYISCSPWIEWKHKRKRRNEAHRAQKQREEIVSTQPGHVQQPGAFQTNGEWVEEILMGPGPPKGWKRDPIVEKLSSEDKSLSLDGTTDHVPFRDEQQAMESKKLGPDTLTGSQIPNTSQSRDDGSAGRHHSAILSNSNAARHSLESAISDSSSASSQPQPRPRPSLERRLSTAMDNFRETIRSTMRPENWNWIRYERDDEILFGFNQRMTEMWNRATSFGLADRTGTEGEMADWGDRTKRRKRADTTDSDGFDYQKYTRNPEVNDLHPPVVSRLPATRDDAAWMILPPPSAAIMEGKTRPQDVPTMRWPLARMGRTPEDWQNLTTARATSKTGPGNGPTESIPELSDSFTETSSSDDEVWKVSARRHSTSVAEASKPAELDLAYLNGGRLPQDRAGLVPRPVSPLS